MPSNLAPTMTLLVQVGLLTRKAAPPQLLAIRLVKKLSAHSVRGAGCQPRAVSFPGVCHEHAVVAAVKDGNVVKVIVATRAHEDAQVVRVQNGVADDVVIESEIKRDAGPGIVVEIKFREQAIRRLITGQTVELVVERGQIPHRQPPHAPRGDEAAGTAAAQVTCSTTESLTFCTVIPLLRISEPSPESRQSSRCWR